MKFTCKNVDTSSEGYSSRNYPSESNLGASATRLILRKSSRRHVVGSARYGMLVFSLRILDGERVNCWYSSMVGVDRGMYRADSNRLGTYGQYSSRFQTWTRRSAPLTIFTSSYFIVTRMNAYNP